MKKSLYIDLDGVILNVLERNYQVYKDILEEQNKKILSKKDYIKLKRKKIHIKEILKKTEAEDIIINFKKKWEKEIESPFYLKLDEIPYLRKKTLLSLKFNYKIILITLRHYPKRLFEQLKNKKIDKIFDKVLTTSGRNSKIKWKLKYNLIKNYGVFDKNSIVIGDTETDILTGKHLRMKTVAVTGGMRSSKILKEYKPDIIIKDFVDFKKCNF